MLRIYSDWMQAAEPMGRVFAAIAKRDSNLAQQARRTAASVTLNIAEGYGSQAGNKRLRYETALGALLETKAALDLAAAWGYIAPMSDARARWFAGLAIALRKLSAKR